MELQKRTRVSQQTSMQFKKAILCQHHWSDTWLYFGNQDLTDNLEQLQRELPGNRGVRYFFACSFAGIDRRACLGLFLVFPFVKSFQEANNRRKAHISFSESESFVSGTFCRRLLRMFPFVMRMSIFVTHGLFFLSIWQNCFFSPWLLLDYKATLASF